MPVQVGAFQSLSPSEEDSAEEARASSGACWEAGAGAGAGAGAAIGAQARALLPQALLLGRTLSTW